MVTKFSDLPDPWWGDVARVYLLLIGHAERRESTTYRKLRDRLGVAPQSINALLRPIQKFCDDNRLPPLPVLVVSDSTGLPGSDHPSNKENLHYDRERVYAWDWLAYEPPRADDLRQQ